VLLLLVLTGRPAVDVDDENALGVGGMVIDSGGETDRTLALGSISADTNVDTAVGTVCASGGGCDN
jgi:hypothetical protein